MALAILNSLVLVALALVSVQFDNKPAFFASISGLMGWIQVIVEKAKK